MTRHGTYRCLVQGHDRESDPIGHAVIRPVTNAPAEWFFHDYITDVSIPAQKIRAGMGLNNRGRSANAGGHMPERLHHCCRADVTGSVCAACCTFKDSEAG